MDFNKFTIIAGPCLIEGEDMLRQTAEKLIESASKYDINFIFKSSYRKANRTSAGSFSGIGDEKAMSFLYNIKKEFNVPITTDVHTAEEAKWAGEFVDIIQIPAFLARQTDIVIAAAETGKYVNIKKAQFMAPEDAVKAAQKAVNAGNNNILLTERGTFFGYHDLVVDYRSLMAMNASGFPVIYDATHSVQQPSIGNQSGGKPEYIEKLARAAVAIGVNGIFFETHPNPKEAKSDAATQLCLDDADNFISNMYQLNKYIKERLSD